MLDLMASDPVVRLQAALEQSSNENSTMKCNNILEAIGHTPLVRLNRLTKDCRPRCTSRPTT